MTEAQFAQTKYSLHLVYRSMHTSVRPQIFCFSQIGVNIFKTVSCPARVERMILVRFKFWNVEILHDVSSATATSIPANHYLRWLRNPPPIQSSLSEKPIHTIEWVRDGIPVIT